MEWFIQRLNQSNPTLDYRDFLEHAKDFKKLKDLKIIKHKDTLKELQCDLCEENHSVSLHKNKEGKLYILCSGSKRMIDTEELKTWSIDKEELEKIQKSKTPIINKKTYSNIENNKDKKIDNNFYITKEEDDYYFEGNLLYFKNKTTIYSTVFDVIYNLKPKGGLVSYIDIITQCKKRKIKVDKKSIQRALTGKDATLFRFIKNLKQKPRYNKSLFVAMQNGKEIEFNNKK